MKTSIVIRFQLEGFHNWPQAKDLMPSVAFLSERHRHMFHFELTKRVTHSDRDVEIILFKREVMKYLTDRYGSPCEFGSRSCEDLAEELINEFLCVRVSVLEDNENGAVVLNS